MVLLEDCLILCRKKVFEIGASELNTENMKKSLLILLLLCTVTFLFTFAADDVVVTTSDVVILTNENFENTIATNSKPWLLEFFAPWCPHCKKLVPIYAEVAEALKGKANVGSIDCTQHRDLCSRFSVLGYPTLFLMSEGKIYEYSDSRTKESLISFVETQYKTAKSLPIPSKPTFIEKIGMEIDQILEGLKHFSRDNFNMFFGGTLGLGLLFGILIGVIIGLFTAPNPPTKSTAPVTPTKSENKKKEATPQKSELKKEK